MKNVIIRKATIRDLEKICVLTGELMQHNSSVQKTQSEKTQLKLVSNIVSLRKKWLAKNLRSIDSLPLVAVVDGEIVGYSLNYIKKNIPPIFVIKKLGYVGDLYLKKGYRGKGIATKFQKIALPWFKKKGMKYSSIGVNAQNKKAHFIYKKWGFFDYHIEMRKKL